MPRSFDNKHLSKHMLGPFFLPQDCVWQYKQYVCRELAPATRAPPLETSFPPLFYGYAFLMFQVQGKLLKLCA